MQEDTAGQGHDPEPMTKAERNELVKLVKMRGRLAKADVDQRKAVLLAEDEEQLSAEYSARHEAWQHVTEHANKLVAEADAEIARICTGLGISERFRPGLNLSWYGRGENADKHRRAELRKLAERRADEGAKAAKLEIDRTVADQLTALASGALESGEARAFLESMPTAEALMPGLSVPALGEG